MRSCRGKKLGSSSDADARCADAALLANRLRRLGVRRPVIVHENRTILVSVDRSGRLRIHRGYAYGSDKILKAIIRFVNAGSRAARRSAEKQVRSFCVDSHVTSRRKPRKRSATPRDRGIIAELEKLHARLNMEVFDGDLSEVPFRISDRMRTRLGEVTVSPDSPGLIEIAISRRHWERDGSAEVETTLLHEMIHQWQAESGLSVDHGAAFRRKAREVGALPAARRKVRGVGAADV